ncbi:heme ABC transporter ATP-binding protein [Paenibacillus sp. 1P07SE]|uniref:heme ABC transporter ATP-binding protein n=1 Tax=Paenibacillus sp. 1P07SE TaxID=3132209 RepID=UPI0039A5CF9A
MIEVRQLIKQAHGRRILDGISFHVEAGSVVGIIGPNGAGKSTLLGAISGISRPDGGQVLLRGRPVADYGRRELARWLAVLQQGGLPPAAFTVREVVQMGRFPFQNWLGDEEADSGALIDRALAAMRLTALADRQLRQLSGGERQRVALAKVMVQQPELILLDEPTTYLDIGYQMQLLDAVRDWQREDGLTVVAVLHDLNLASQYCDRLLVLHDGRLTATGRPHEVLTAELLREVYGADASVLSHPQSGSPQVLLNPRRSGPGDPALALLDKSPEQRGGTR